MDDEAVKKTVERIRAGPLSVEAFLESEPDQSACRSGSPFPKPSPKQDGRWKKGSTRFWMSGKAQRQIEQRTSRP